MRNLEKIIDQHRGPYEVDEFVELIPASDLQARLEKAKKCLDSAKKIEEIRQFARPEKLSLPEVNFEEIKQLLSTSIEEVLVEAEKMVRIHIENNLGGGAEDWLRKSLNYYDEKNKKCPFCGQNICNNNLIEAYKNYFNISYKKLKENIEDNLNKTKKKFNDQVWVIFEKTLEKNASIKDLWNSKLPELYFPNI